MRGSQIPPQFSIRREARFTPANHNSARNKIKAAFFRRKLPVFHQGFVNHREMAARPNIRTRLENRKNIPNERKNNQVHSSKNV